MFCKHRPQESQRWGLALFAVFQNVRHVLKDPTLQVEQTQFAKCAPRTGPLQILRGRVGGPLVQIRSRYVAMWMVSGRLWGVLLLLFYYFTFSFFYGGGNG